MNLTSKNTIAQVILNHLPDSKSPQVGYFGGKTYCIGVPVSDVAEAFDLGATMGSEIEYFGELGFDKIGSQLYVVFRSAEVAQSMDLEEKPLRYLVEVLGSGMGFVQTKYGAQTLEGAQAAEDALRADDSKWVMPEAPRTTRVRDTMMGTTHTRMFAEQAVPVARPARRP